ncbi:iron transporter [Actinorhabdospora filicis]|uniref:Iron transporter n=1 Tax=Actinorhabdospora filicis TaxID=1785913 RepID=A0A9W6WAN5_9ACTN|nr:IucA/IucC family protein [Actinorhabdospora filicis]GLZ79193.1 iron transporter [Actinorhabdospora filicis]
MTHATAAHAHVRDSVLAAAWREDVAGLRTHGVPGLDFTARHLDFDQIEPTGPVRVDGREATTAGLLERLGLGEPVLAEVTDAAANLGLALARRAAADEELRAKAAELGAGSSIALARRLSVSPAFEPCLFFERLAVHGHHLHPCARTRLGMDTADLLVHDLEGPGAPIRFLAARSDRLRLSGPTDAATLLREGHPELDKALAEGLRPGETAIPVHPWQYGNVVRQRYGGLFADGTLRELPGASLPSEPTISLRTLVTAPGTDGRRWQVKCALDVQITSTRRTISAATAHNGPAVSAALGRIAAADPLLAARVGVLPELAGVSVRGEGGVTRDLTSVLREGFGSHTRPGELPVPGCALYARSPIGGRSVLAELVAEHGDPADFLARYVDLVVPPVLRLAAMGVGLEAHLQNSVPVFVGGTPVRMLFRDWGGARLHGARMAAAGHALDLYPGSVVATESLDTMRAKVAYTAFQAHLGEIVRLLAAEFGLPTRESWRLVAAAVAEHAAPEDREFFLGPTLPHKALLTMRVRGDGDHYVPVRNPMREEGR